MTNGEGERIIIKLSARAAGRKAWLKKEMKKFLTNGFRFDILNKLLLRSGGQKKLRKRRELIENLEKRSKKVLDKRNLI